MLLGQKVKCFTLTAMFFVFFSNYSERIAEPRNKTINTELNKVGIEKNDICQYLGKKNIIMCKSGKCFKDINIIVGSSTGTPPWLMYKNYIGSYLPKSNKQKMLPGQARRLIFCHGKCELIEKTIN